MHRPSPGGDRRALPDRNGGLSRDEFGRQPRVARRATAQFFRHQASAFLILLTAGDLLLTALVLASVTELLATSWFGQLLNDVPGLMLAVDLALRYPATLLLIVVVGLILYFVPNTDVGVGDV